MYIFSKRNNSKGIPTSLTKSGFSLVEILVSLGLFAVVATISIGTLLVLIDANAKAQTLKATMDNLSFALDNMTRGIRTGNTYNCSGTLPNSPTTLLPTSTNDCSTGELGLAFTDGKNGDRIAFRRNTTDETIERRRDSTEPTRDHGWVAITAPEAHITDLEFIVTGTTIGDDIQPTASIWIEGYVGEFENTKSSFKLQTTVTQRILDL